MKNDECDAQDLAAMLRLGRLAEGWIVSPEIRELRELVHHRTSAKAQIHGVMAKNGIVPVVAEWGPLGTAQLDRLEASGGSGPPVGSAGPASAAPHLVKIRAA